VHGVQLRAEGLGYLRSMLLSTIDSRAFPVTTAKIWNTQHESVISESYIESLRHNIETFLLRSNTSALSSLVDPSIVLILWPV